MNANLLLRLFVAWLTYLAPLLFVPVLLAAETEEMPPVTTEDNMLPIRTDNMLQPWKGDLPGMTERRTIRVLTVYSKTLSLVGKGTQRGATHDIFMALKNDLNKQLAKDKKLKQHHLKLHIVFMPVNRDNLFIALNEGKGGTVTASLTIAPSREAVVDFAQPLYSSVKELLISGPALPKVDSLEQLSSQAVFVRRSSSHYENLQALSARFASESRSPVILEAAPEAPEDEGLLEMFNAGPIPLIVVDQHKAVFWKQVFLKVQIHDSVILRDSGNTTWTVRKDSPQLLAMLNNFVKKNRQDATLGNTLLLCYLKNAEYVKNAAANRERREFLAMVEVFHKYGDHYDVDWLLMAAQGYQESRLNQSVRGRVGAVEVTQVMPSTGKKLGVGDIKRLDPNTHTGVRYMCWMIDRYYTDESMARLDKAPFTSASYNAGPARIARLRTMTKQRGFDPNVWFDNVENLTAEKIGAETITYVNNIYKYYIAYRLVVDDMTHKQKVTAVPRQGSATGPVKPQPSVATPEIAQTPST